MERDECPRCGVLSDEHFCGYENWCEPDDDLGFDEESERGYEDSYDYESKNDLVDIFERFERGY